MTEGYVSNISVEVSVVFGASVLARRSFCD